MPKVRTSQVFGEVNVFLPADWERGVHLLNRLTLVDVDENM